MQKPTPPRWADRLLEWFCAPHLLEEVQGDLHERFEKSVRVFGEKTARRDYVISILGFIRPFALKRNKELSTASLYIQIMISNYFKIAFRNLLKYKGYSFINIAGLAIGLASCMTIGLFIWDELSYDKFHTNGKSIYRAVERQNQAGELYDIAYTPGPLAPGLKADYPEVQEATRIRHRGLRILQHKETTIEIEKTAVTDNAFFKMFDFKLERGNVKTILLQPKEVVITENTAEKLFGSNWRQSDKILGEALIMNNEDTLTLAGVVQNTPVNSHIQFDALVSVKTYEGIARSYRWGNNDYYTYLQLKPEADVAALEKKIVNYIKDKEPNSSATLLFQPFHDIYLHSNFAFNTDSGNKTSKIIYIKIFSVVGLIILLIALFNFINLATARAMQRAREVGVRKAIGAMRKQLVFQFLGESVLMSFIAVFFAIFLLVAFLPLMNNLSAKAIAIPFTNPYFYLIIIGLTLLISLLAGSYPAFYLSGFQPVKVLKGVFKIGSGQAFRRSLVVSQFVFSIILIIGTIVIYKQLNYMQNKSLGFDKSQLLVVRMKNNLYQNSANMKADLQKQSSVTSVALSSTNLIDVNNSTHAIKWEGQAEKDQFLMTLGNIDADFLPSAGIKLITGRNFNASIVSDTSSAYIVNVSATKRMGWTPEQAIGKTFELWETKGKIIGVVQDFHFHPLTTAIEPFLFRYWPNEFYSRMLVKTNPGQVHEAIAAIEKFYKQYEKQTAPQYEFLDQALDNQYRAEQRTGTIVLYFSVLAIFVSCLGLFGLATFSAEQRTKEIGIRKVLGASVMSITTLLSKDFIRLVLVANSIAFPIAFYAMNSWLKDFSYRISIEWWVFVVAGLLAIVIALLTVSYQAIKAALMNPVKTLKTE
jgi:putative ABC transport system permease protein